MGDSLIDIEEHGLEKMVTAFEKEIIQTILDKNHGNLSKASKILCIPRQTLKYKVDKYGITTSR